MGDTTRKNTEASPFLANRFQTERVDCAGGYGRKFFRQGSGNTPIIHESHPRKELKAYQIREFIAYLYQESNIQMSQTMRYGGPVLYSAEDKLLHGRLPGIRDFVIYDAEDVVMLEKDFQSAVDEILAFCEAEGNTPNKPFKGSLNERLREDLHLRAARLVEEHNCKLNAVISDAVNEYLAQAS